MVEFCQKVFLISHIKIELIMYDVLIAMVDINNYLYSLLNVPFFGCFTCIRNVKCEPIDCHGFSNSEIEWTKWL